MWQESRTAVSLGKPPVSGAMPHSQSCGDKAGFSGQVANANNGNGRDTTLRKYASD